MQKSKSKSTIAIYGTERITILEAVQSVLDNAGSLENGAFDYVEFDGRTANNHQILDAASALPFLSEKRTVLVRRAHKLDKTSAAAIAEAIPNLPETTLLILVLEPDEEGKPLDKDVLVTAGKKHGQAIACEPPQGSALTKQLIDRAKAADAELTKQGAEELSRLVSGSLTAADAELEKLVLFAGGAKIDEHMVRKVAAPSQSWKVFELLDAVTQGRLGVALENLKYLLEETSSPQEAAMRFLLPQLHRQVRLLWQARACLDAKLPPENAPNLLPKGKNLANAHSFVRGKLAASAKNIDLGQIAGMLRCIVEADMRMKGQLPSANPRETLERLLAEMCEIAAGRNTAVSL